MRSSMHADLHRARSVTVVGGESRAESTETKDISRSRDASSAASLHVASDTMAIVPLYGHAVLRARFEDAFAREVLPQLKKVRVPDAQRISAVA